MVKPHRFPYGLKEYCRRGKQNLFPELTGCPNPSCTYEGRLRHHGFYPRNALSILFVGIALIHRYYCPACRRTVTLLPTYFIPRFQYSYTCILFAFYLLAVCRLTLNNVCTSVNDFSCQLRLSYQHIRFYRNRLLENAPLLILFLGSMNIVLDKRELSCDLKFIENILKQLERCDMELFSISYFSLFKRHFMSKS